MWEVVLVCCPLVASDHLVTVVTALSVCCVCGHSVGQLCNCSFDVTRGVCWTVMDGG